MKSEKCDFLVIGTGLAGLSFALKAAEYSKVILISKSTLEHANSPLAQGGIASVMSKEDSLESHINDTLIAGAGLCNLDIVKMVVSQAESRIQDLVNWGVKFDLENGKDFSLTKEGGHTHRRILHIADQSGMAIHQPLLKLVKNHPNIKILENHLALDLILNKQINENDFSPSRCVGAYVLNKNDDFIFPITSKSVILATGGAGKVYLYTSNWSGATGDGIAMAHRAGARVNGLEFMQFHPTCLYHPQARNFLISEALRGEGGELVDLKGHAFMHKYHVKGSLAPRDIVARSIDEEMKKSGADCVYLDMTKLNHQFLIERFPSIHNKCIQLGIDMTKQPIPVVPAAHYLCGGILTDKNGKTDIENLFAIGECANTGLHGANRLASNSLLECLVFSHNANQLVKSQFDQLPPPVDSVPEWFLHDKEDTDELIVVSHIWEEIRRLMWNYVGIVRTRRRLERAEHRLSNILNEIKEYYSNFKTHSDIVELRNIATVAELTVKCAMDRKESCGIHFVL